MKKRLFTILTIVFGTMCMVSCGGDDPDPAPPVNDTNAKILTVMKNNYLWSVPANPNLSLGTEAFFASLLSTNDRYTDVNANGQPVNYTYSRISPVTAPVTTYDIGFEYAINKYVSGVTYYVMLYVKPNTPANAQFIRGLYITKVNGTTVTSDNAATLLPLAYKDGQPVTLSVMTPMITNLRDVKINPVANYIEKPLLTSSVFNAGTKKVGYICYNSFSAGTNGSYDTELANKLNEFKSQGVKTLVFDVRYNSSGNANSAVVAGSGMVKNRDTNKAFIQQIFRPDLPTPSIALNFRDNTLGGTAISKLGDDLDKIYIITGQSTAGAPEALINAIKEYRSADIVLVGEKTKGRTIAVAKATENGLQAGNWSLTLAFSYLADAKMTYNYASGFTPNVVIKEVEEAAKAKVLLGNLGEVEGTYKEIILTQIKDIIAGTPRSTSVLETRSSSDDRPLQTSLGNRPGSNETTVNLQQ